MKNFYRVFIGFFSNFVSARKTSVQTQATGKSLFSSKMENRKGMPEKLADKPSSYLLPFQLSFLLRFQPAELKAS